MTDLTYITVKHADIDVVRQAYKRFTGNRPDGRWSELRLRDEVGTLIVLLEAAEQRKAAEEAQAAADRAARSALAASRGFFEEFAKNTYGRVDLPADEVKLANAAYVALNQKAEAEKQIAKFATEVVANPSYALSWSVDMFKHAARIEIADRFQKMVEAGHSLEVIKGAVLKQAMQLASNSSRSTSPTSNLMEDERRVAWANLARELGFNYY